MLGLSCCFLDNKQLKWMEILAINQGNNSAFQHIRLRLNELPDGARAIYMHTPEMTEGKYPSICVSFSLKRSAQNSVLFYGCFVVAQNPKRKICFQKEKM